MSQVFYACRRADAHSVGKRNASQKDEKMGFMVSLGGLPPAGIICFQLSRENEGR